MHCSGLANCHISCSDFPKSPCHQRAEVLLHSWLRISHLFYLRLPRFKATSRILKEILVFATPYILNANEELPFYFDRFWIAQKLSDYELANYTLLFSVAEYSQFHQLFTMTNQKHLYQGNFDYEAAKHLKQSDVLGFLSMVVVIPFSHSSILRTTTSYLTQVF